ncbi:MAG: Nucleotidyltransferase domain protein [Chloroflexi bacterium ADurb.Bin325]|nr:MAG: Nucleotidyltransferase domain protein [Chloroflexi bacterium ADurb.Bin325]
MDTRTLLYSRRQDVIRLAGKHGARNVRVFGSVARGDARPDSDIDLLVELEPGRSLFDLGGLLFDLQDLLGVDVDVVTENGLRPRIRAQVLQEAIPL